MIRHLLRSDFRRLYQRTLEVLWAAAVISLPFTSFPLLVNMTGAIVAPLSAIPVFFLILLWFIPYILKRGSLPRESIPVIIFGLVALLSCALAFFIDIPGYKGGSVPGEELRALFTLAVGLAFFLVFSSWPQNQSQLQKTCKWLTIGGTITVMWALFQSSFIFFQVEEFPTWFLRYQKWLVIQSPYFDSPRSGRIAGLTYEASWLAHQLVILYIPLWLTATYQRTSAFKFRLFRLSLENVLLILAVGIFFMTSPRIGLLSLFLVGFYIFSKINLKMLRRLVTWITQHNWFTKSRSKTPLRIGVTLLTSGLILGIYALILGGVVYFASKRDWRMEILVTDPPTWMEIKAFLTLQESVLLDLAHRLVFMERMVYWFTGWHIFNNYPWFGVGLGNAGFFTLQEAPAMGWASFEVRAYLFRLDYLPNIKSLWVRLFAETGLAGFSVFTAWLVMLYRSARITLRSKLPILQMIAFAGQLSLIAFIGEGFSIDSFALPYYWVAAGLIAAASWIYRKQLAG